MLPRTLHRSHVYSPLIYVQETREDPGWYHPPWFFQPNYCSNGMRLLPLLRSVLLLATLASIHTLLMSPTNFILPLLRGQW